MADRMNAFPMSIPRTGSTEHHYGMSMRDWFAGMALQGLLASMTMDDVVEIDATARDAYRYADSMIKEMGARNV